MDIESLKRGFGEEYPAAVVVKGVRLPLIKERRFSRSYHSADHKLATEISRFMDGSASITLNQLVDEWPQWTDSERLDFCGSCSWLNKQPDFPEMLRYIMRHGGPIEWSEVALRVAELLPQAEAFDILLQTLDKLGTNSTSNIAQAIAETRHTQAESVLRSHLQSLWANPSLSENSDFSNRIAFDATTCIAHLIELGASPADFEPYVRRISEHPCSGNRDSCRNFLSKYYLWLNQSAP